MKPRALRVFLILSLFLVSILFPAGDFATHSPTVFEHSSAPTLPTWEPTSRKGLDVLGEIWNWARSLFNVKHNFFQDYVGHVRPAWATTEFEYYTAGDDSASCMWNRDWRGQTFTVGAAAHTVTTVKVLIYRVATPGAIGYLSIRATSGGLPTGGDLTSGTITISGVTTNTAGAWYTVTVTEYTLAANTQYAIIVRADSGVYPTSELCWRVDGSSPSYNGGTYLRSTNSGSNWTSYSGEDALFDIWGNPTTVTITWALSGVSNDASGTIITIDSVGYSYADFPKAFSWAIGGTHSVAATDPVSAGTGKQYLWSSWGNGDGLSGSSGTYTTPGSAITVTAVYGTQWYLTVTSSYGSPTGQGWYTSGSTASSSVTSPASGGSGVQYLCTGWTGTGSAPASGSTANTGTFSMTQASSVTWSWQTQYQVTFTSNGVAADTSGTIVTVNGTARTQAQLPYSIWVNATHHASYAFSSPVAASAGKQYLWSNTTGLSQTLQSNTFVVSGTGTVTGAYYIQWQVSVTQSGIGGDTAATVLVVVNGANKAAGDLPFTAWYNNSASISYTYTLNVVGSSFQYVWVSTSGCSQTARSATFSVTASGILTGNYGVLGGTATVTTTIVQTTTTGTTATLTTTSVNTQTTTETMTSVTIGLTLTSTTTATSTYTNTSFTTAIVIPPPPPPPISIHVTTWIGVVNQSQVVVGEVSVTETGANSMVITSVEFSESWITLNDSRIATCSCYGIIGPGIKYPLHFRVAPGFDVPPNIIYKVTMRLEARASSGQMVSADNLAIDVTVYSPYGVARTVAVPQPLIEPAKLASAAIVAAVTTLVAVVIKRATSPS